MSRLFWDTNIFIYLFENYGSLSQLAESLRGKMLARGDQLLTSTLTLGEVLVKPLEQKDFALAARYETAITSACVTLPFNLAAAKIYADLRSDRSIRPPDAIQLSCAASAGIDLFVTNDSRLQGKQVTGIQFIVPLDRVPI
ncbi:MAG TPA: type II toxin-antitoxin system VapC family toxin [Candidatus Angelobacter sp.]|nr:type II toxin-antitoxin system VapC family toxin [Candidatus Angelobacter sp.]